MALSKKKQKQLLEQGFKVDLDPNSKRYQPRVINPGTRGLLDRTFPPSPIVPKKPTPSTDGRDQVPSTDGRDQVPRVDPGHPVQTVCTSPSTDGDDQASSTDGRDQVPSTDGRDQASIPLSKQQWDVWNLLRSVSNSHEIVSYRIIAERLKIKPNGARRAVEAIQKERGLLKKETVRTATTQGFRIEVNSQVRFHQVDKHVTYGILKRGLSQVPSTDRLDMDPSTDVHSMYVSKIRHTYYKELLRLFPPAWKLRERTLRHIESQNPTLSPIHLKTSYLYLIGQAQSGKQKIKDHNAWLIGCFKAGAPITETDIEMLLENHYTGKPSKNPSGQSEENKRGQQSDEMEILRKYVAISDTDRAEIDRLAETKAAPLLAQVGEDKHAGIREQAKIEAAREYFNL